jgi:hypothetical protein
MLVELVKVNKGLVIYPLKVSYNQSSMGNRNTKECNKPKNLS